MKLVIAIVSLVALLTGCDNGKFPTSYTVYVDPAFGDRVGDVVSSLEDWESKSGVQLDIVISNAHCDKTCNSVITIHQTSLANIQSMVPDQPDVIGYTQYDKNGSKGNGYEGWANVYVTPDFQLQTLRHEEGHSLGLLHQGSGQLMCADQGCAALDITCEDINQYNTLRGSPNGFCNQ